MARWPRRVLIVALVGASLLSGCFLGGQTGEDSAPSGGGPSCVLAQVPSGQKLSGVSPADLAHAFEGSHTAQLAWTSFPDGGTRKDTVTIVVTYQGDGGTRCDTLKVPVTVELTSSDGAVHASGTGSLESAVGSTSAAKLSFGDGSVQVSADLKQVNGTVTVTGTVSDGRGHTGVFASPGILGTGGAPGTP